MYYTSLLKMSTHFPPVFFSAQEALDHTFRPARSFNVHLEPDHCVIVLAHARDADDLAGVLQGMRYWDISALALM